MTEKKLLVFGKNWFSNNEKYCTKFYKLLENYDGRFKPIMVLNENYLVFEFESTWYELSDNGGELNIHKVNDYKHLASVPYMGNGFPVNLYSLFLMFTKSIENGELFYTTESLSDEEIETLITHNDLTRNGKVIKGEVN